MDLAGSGYRQLAVMCECGDEHSGFKIAGNSLTSCKTVSFSRRTVLDGVSE
jgi:hypothetical protein